MKTGLSICVALALACFALSASALNKCVEADGKVAYTDAPCAGSAKKAELQIRAVPTPSASSAGDNASPNADAKKLKSLQNTRREREIKAEIEQLEDEISVNQVRMDRDLERLRRKKSSSNNNLAGATWEQSISTEMQAVTATYTTKIEMAQGRIRNLSDELSGIRGAK